MPPKGTKKAGSRKQANPKQTVTKTEEEKLEEELTADVKQTRAMTTRGGGRGRKKSVASHVAQEGSSERPESLDKKRLRLSKSRDLESKMNLTQILPIDNKEDAVDRESSKQEEADDNHSPNTSVMSRNKMPTRSQQRKATMQEANASQAKRGQSRAGKSKATNKSEQDQSQKSAMWAKKSNGGSQSETPLLNKQSTAKFSVVAGSLKNEKFPKNAQVMAVESENDADLNAAKESEKKSAKKKSSAVRNQKSSGIKIRQISDEKQEEHEQVQLMADVEVPMIAQNEINAAIEEEVKVNQSEFHEGVHSHNDQVQVQINNNENFDLENAQTPKRDQMIQEDDGSSSSSQRKRQPQTTKERQSTDQAIADATQIAASARKQQPSKQASDRTTSRKKKPNELLQDQVQEPSPQIQQMVEPDMMNSDTLKLESAPSQYETNVEPQPFNMQQLQPPFQNQNSFGDQAPTFRQPEALTHNNIEILNNILTLGQSEDKEPIQYVASDQMTAQRESVNNSAQPLQVPQVEKVVKSKARKSEIPIPEAPPKLSEEEIRMKYTDNEEYQEWQKRVQRLKNDFERGLKRGLPKIYQAEDEFQSLINEHERNSKLREIISEKYHDFKVQNIEPSGEDPENADISTFFEDDSVKKAFFKLIVFQIEGSPLSLKELRQTCYRCLVNDHFPDLSSKLEEYTVEELILRFALRKSYGIKAKNPNIYTDTTPIALWCWEIQETQLLDPVPEAQIKKARTHRVIVGKKLQALSYVLDLSSDYTTFDSSDRISKLSQEFENYNKLLTRESQSDWVMRKRKFNETENNGELQRISSVPAQQNDARPNNSTVGTKQNRTSLPANKKLKANDDTFDQLNLNEQSEILLPNEQSGMPPTGGQQQVAKKGNAVTKELVQQNMPPQGNKLLESFFKKVDKPTENPSVFVLKAKEEQGKNKFLTYGSTCETEAMKIRQNFLAQQPTEWPAFNTKAIINKFKAFKNMELEKVKQENQSQNRVFSGEQPSIKRKKHIQIHDSGMSYNGVYFDKKSRIITCKKPFLKDPTIIDYNQDSEEEWEEINGENLEDDDNLLDEENMEVVEDEADQIGLPNAGLSAAMKQKLAFRSQYCFSTLQYKDDAEDLKQEGFIVADDYFSQNSSFVDATDQDQGLELSRKELLIKQLERNDNRLKSSAIMRPYILLDTQVNLGDYKAVRLLKKKSKQKPSTSRYSFSGASTADESIPDFPISVIKVKREAPNVMEIKDVIGSLIEIGHGTTLTKKQLIELLRKEHQDLKKTHVDLFVKECFEKQKRPLDSKTRLYAKVEAIEKYGITPELIESMPLILEKKIEEEKIAALSVVPETPVQSNKQTEPGQTDELKPPPQSTAKQQSRKHSRVPSASASKQQNVAQSQQPSKEHPRLSQIQQLPTMTISQSQFNEAVGGASSIQAQRSIDSRSHEAQSEALHDPTISESDIGETNIVNTTATNQTNVKQSHSSENRTAVAFEQDVDMIAECSGEGNHAAHDENSWMNVQAAAIETPAFNTKVYELGESEVREHNDLEMMENNQEDGAADINQFLHNESKSSHHLTHTISQISQSFLEDQQISLSQHAIVQYNQSEDQQEVEIGESTYSRANQQHHSTPIHNFRTLRSRDISAKNSQNCIIEDEKEIEPRPRSDSIETEKGYPLHQDGQMNNLALLEEGGIASANFGNQHSFDTPKRDQLVGNVPLNQNPIVVDLEAIPESANFYQYEENKEQNGLDVSFKPQNENHDVPDSSNNNQIWEPQPTYLEEVKMIEDQAPHDAQPSSPFGMGASKKRIARNSTKRSDIFATPNEAMANPRRSKRLESRHKALLQDSFYQDELDHAYSQSYTAKK